jgi:hypothetical protein
MFLISKTSLIIRHKGGGGDETRKYCCYHLSTFLSFFLAQKCARNECSLLEWSEGVGRVRDSDCDGWSFFLNFF